uniref:EGF-like domain-containing protein 8 n=1 Tax=Magallana gigas TaxID=29159 RepID=K1RRP1_MAGGI
MRIAYRTVFRKRVIPGEYKRCCPGWTKENPRDLACLAPICRHGCQNGGICVGPNQCECPPYYTGHQCEKVCPLCLPQLETMMNQVNTLQGRINMVEKEKEEMRGNFSVLERYYNDAMVQVEELKSYTTPPPTTTTEDPYEFDIISSLSDQISHLEEKIGSCEYN